MPDVNENMKDAFQLLITAFGNSWGGAVAVVVAIIASLGAFLVLKVGHKSYIIKSNELRRQESQAGAAPENLSDEEKHAKAEKEIEEVLGDKP